MYRYTRPAAPVIRKPPKGFRDRPVRNAPGCVAHLITARSQWDILYGTWHIAWTYNLAEATQIARDWLTRKGYEL